RHVEHVEGRCDVESLRDDPLTQLIPPEVRHAPGVVPGRHDALARVEQALDDVHADKSHAAGDEDHLCPPIIEPGPPLMAPASASALPIHGTPSARQGSTPTPR